MRRGSKPSATKKPSQNWWVDQILRTRGMPTRSSDRDFGGAESFVPNHFSHVGISMSALLDSSLHHPQFAGIFDEALGAGIAADNTLEALPHRYLAPWPALGVGQDYVDEGAFAGATAPAAGRVFVGGAAIGQLLDGVETAEAAGTAALPGVVSA